jgi:hypothetical protein
LKKLLFAACLATAAFAQSSDDGDNLVYVPKKYVSAEGLTHQQAPKAAEEASKWLGFGKEVGQAMNDGLAAVVTQADKFGATKVGTFVMVMIAFKIMGKEAISIVLGLPVCFLGVMLWIWSVRRFFWAHRILVRRDGTFFAPVKEWKIEKYDFENNDGKSWCVAIHVCFLAAWLITWVAIIF